MEDEAVQAVLADLRIRKAILVNSMVVIALAFAELYPDFVKGYFIELHCKRR
jgi:hypothetical protein